MLTGMDKTILLSNIYDTDDFLSKFNHYNNYTYHGYQLQIGNIIVISSEIISNRNISKYGWYIAGFDCEKSRVASDGTTYDNGYGIALVKCCPESNSTSYHNTSGYVPYSSSSIRSNLNNMYDKAITILDSHLVNRNVLLSSGVDSTGSSQYSWYTDKFTLMSGCQITGIKSAYSNKYDDGEANYKLPLFDVIDPGFCGDNGYWLRGIKGKSGTTFNAYYVSDNTISYSNAYGSISSGAQHYCCPMIYIH